MMVLVYSLLVLLQAFIVIQLVRFITKQALPEHVFRVLDEYLAFLQLSCGILELGVVSKLYGFRSVQSIGSTFIFLSMKHILFFKGGYIGNPVAFVESFYNSNRRIRFSTSFAVIITIAEILGSLSAHPFLRILWGKSFCEFHKKEVFRECQSTLEVSCMTGFLVEICASFISFASDMLTPYKAKPPIRAIVTILLCQALQKTSGVWMHPVIATAHTFRCVGHGNTWEHVLVYWVGPAIGVALVFELKNLGTMLIKAVKYDRTSKVGKKTESADKIQDRNSKDVIIDAQGEDFIKGLPANGKSIPYKKYDRSPNGSLRPRKSLKKSRGW